MVLKGELDELQAYLAAMKRELKTVDPSKLVVHLRLGKDLPTYKNNIPIVRAAKNSSAPIFRGDFINLLYTKSGEINWDGVSPVEIDYAKYIDVYITQKMTLLGKEYGLLATSQRTLDHDFEPTPCS